MRQLRVVISHWKLLACLALTMPSAASWAICTDVIALSRITSRTVTNESDFAKMAKAFCTQYSSSKASGSGMSVGVQYAGIGGSYGSTDSSAEAIASRTCDSLNTESVSSSAYQNYVEAIAPGAYPAYERCILAEQGGIQFSADPASAGEMSLVFAVTNGSRNNVPVSQTFEFQESAGVSCKWKGAAAPGGQKTLGPNMTSSAYCTRTDSSKRASVVVYSTTRGDLPVTFVWQEYKAGQKVDDLLSLQARVSASEITLGSIQSSVVAFNSTTCPFGWKQYMPANGRFIRGIDVGATNVDPDGQRVPGDPQADMVKKHIHPSQGQGVQPGAGGFTVGSGGVALKSAEFVVTGDSDTMGPETRPKNIALLYCTRG